MARIPSYTATSRAISNPGTPVARPIPIQDFSSKGLIEGGNALFEISAGLLKAADDDSALKARTSAQIELNKLEMELQTADPMEALETYDERAQSIIEQTGERLSNNARKTFNTAAAELSMRGKIAVQKDGIRRGRQKLEASLLEGVNAQAILIRPDDRPNDRDARADTVREMLATAVTNRIIDAGKAENYFIKFKNEADKARAAFEIQKSPEEIRQFIEAASKGTEYKNLDGEDRAKFIDRARKRLKNLDLKSNTDRKVREKRYTGGANDLIRAIMADGSASEEDQEKYSPKNIAKQIADPEVARALSNRFQDQIKFQNTRNAIGKDMSNSELLFMSKSAAEDSKREITLPALAIQDAQQSRIIQARIKQIIGDRAKTFEIKQRDFDTKEREVVSKVKSLLQTVKNGGTLDADLISDYTPDKLKDMFRDPQRAEALSKLLQDQVQYQKDRDRIKDENLTNAELKEIQERYNLDIEGTVSENETTLDQQNRIQREAVFNQIKPILEGRATKFVEKMGVILAQDSQSFKVMTQEDQDRISNAEIDANISDPVVREKLKKMRETSLNFNDIKRMLVSSSLPSQRFVNQEATEAAQEPGISEDEFEQRKKIQDTLERATAAIVKNRLENPAAAMIQQSQNLNELFNRYLNDPTKASYENYANALNVEYDRLEIGANTRRLMPKKMAQDIVNTLANQISDNPKEAVNQINNYRTIMGNDFPDFVKDLKGFGLDKRISMLFVIDSPYLQDKLVSIMGNTSTSDAMKSANTKNFQSDLNKTFGPIETASKTDGMPLTQGMREAVTLLAVEKMRTGDVASQTKAMKDAYKEVVTDNYLIVSTDKLRGVVPKSDRQEIDANSATISLVSWIDRNPGILFDRQQFTNLIDPSESAEAAQIKMTGLMKQASWQMTPDGQAAQPYDRNGTIITDIEGNPITVNIDQSINDYKRFNRAQADRSNSSTRRTRQTIGAYGGGATGDDD